MPTLYFNALNISARPHPEGIYRELFERVAAKRTNYYGDKIAAISKPSAIRNEIFWGYIFSWTEIDKNQKIIDTVLLSDPDEEKLAKLNIPDNLGFNAQVFHYVFRLKDHVLVFETRNSEGRTLAPGSGENIFRGLFSDKSLSPIKFELPKPSVEVDLVLENDAIEKVLALKSIRNLEIVVSIPNNDTNTKDADDLIERLKKIKAQTQLIRYKAAAGESINTDDETIKAQSNAAIRHGYVKSEGKNQGRVVARSSKDYPRGTPFRLGRDQSAADAAQEVAQSFKGIGST